MSWYQSSYPVSRASIIRHASPVRTSVIRHASPVRTSVIRQASPVRTSVIRQASPVRAYASRCYSPVRSYVRGASPIRSYVGSRVSPIRSYARCLSPVRSYIRASPVRAVTGAIRGRVTVDPVTRIVGDGISTSAQVDCDGQEYAKEVDVDQDQAEDAQIFDSLEGENQIADGELLGEGQPQEDADIQVVNVDDDEDANAGDAQEELSNHGDDQGEEVNADPVVDEN